MFKVGFALESNRLQQQQPRRSTNWLKPVVGGAATAGLGYLADRHLNGGSGMNWLKQQFSGSADQQPSGSTASHQLRAYNNAVVQRANQTALDNGKLESFGRLGSAAGMTAQTGAQQASRWWNNRGVSAVPQGVAAASKAAVPAMERALPGLTAAKAGWAGRLIPGLGAVVGGLDEAIASNGMFNVNLGQPTNRTLGALGGAVVSLNPIGLAGNILGNAGIGAYNWHTGVQAGKNELAGNLGDTAVELTRGLKRNPQATSEYARQFLQLPAVQQTINNPVARHPATTKALEHLQTILQQQQPR